MNQMYLVLNFKTYPEASGEAAVELAREVVNVQQETDVNLVIAPQAADIYRIREQFPNLNIWAQHVDNQEPGTNTGWTSLTTVLMSGANGTLLNHSEHPIAWELLVSTVEIARSQDLTICICAPNVEMGLRIAELHPDLIAFEPPSLIGGPKSVIEEAMDEAKQFVVSLEKFNIPLLIGSGIKSTEDAASASHIGYQGVLLASGFVKATDKQVFLNSIISGFAS